MFVELKATINSDNVKIQSATIDYTKFELRAPVVNDSDMPHVLEVYDFPSDLKTQDIVAAITAAG